MPDLNDLSFYAAVVANGGFSAAARALAIPKSRISRRVAALESQLGVRLIERSTRRFSVTELGQDVYRRARAALAEVESIDEVASRLKSEPQGLVRISCPQGADRVLAAELPAFLKSYPRLRVQIVVGNRRVDLIEESIDVAVRVREKLDTDSELQVKIIGRGTAMLVASPSFLDKHGRPEKPADIPTLPTLSHMERAGFDRWTLIDAQNNQEVVVHQPRLAANNFDVLRLAAIEGIGIALLPDYSCWSGIRDGLLERILLNWSAPEGIIHLVFTSRRGLLPGVRAVIDFAAKILDPKSPSWRPEY